MRDAPATRDSLDGGVPAGHDEASTLVGPLRRASAALDSMWRDALAGAANDAAVRLGEASLGIHRALIALDQLDPFHRPAANGADRRVAAPGGSGAVSRAVTTLRPSVTGGGPTLESSTVAGRASNTGRARMLVRDVATVPAVLCQTDATIAEVARQMREQQVGSVIVVDEGNHVVGVVTDRDLAVRGLAAGLSSETRIAEVMTRDVVTLPEDADVLAASAQMASWACRRVPLVAADGSARGMLTVDDVALALAELMENLARAVRTETHAGQDEPVGDTSARPGPG